MLEQLLQKLIEDMEMGETPQKNEMGAYPLVLSSDLQVNIKALDPGLFFYAPLAPLQPQKREELLIYLMKANFLGQGTGDAVIGLDSDEKSLTLSLVLPYDINYKAFKEALEDFVNYVDFWKAELARFKKESEE